MTENAKARPRLVWIVVKGEGLHQVPADKVNAKIAKGKGRRATDRDLSIAGVTGAPVADEAKPAKGTRARSSQKPKAAPAASPPPIASASAEAAEHKEA